MIKLPSRRGAPPRSAAAEHGAECRHEPARSRSRQFPSAACSLLRLLTIMRKPLFLASALCTVLAIGACGDDDGDCDSDDINCVPSATLTVTNNSDFTIVQFFLTDVGNPTFGPNLLSSPLRPGDQLTLAVSCGFFDALLVDEQNVDCELHDLDLCANNADFIVRNNACTVFGARKAEQEAAKATTGSNKQ